MTNNNPIIAAERTRNVRYAIREIVAIANKRKDEGKENINLNIGDPLKYDFETPAHIVRAICLGVTQNENYYGPSFGTAEAVLAITNEARLAGIKNIVRVCVTTGSSEGIELALTSLVNPGENILLPSPGYPLYPAVLSKLGAELKSYYLDEDNEWQPDPDSIRQAVDEKTKAIVVINPNNPTGSIANKDTLKKIVDIAKENNLVIFADEIYDKIIFDDSKHVSIASIAGDHPCVTFNGLAKCYLGPGLRIGWAVFSGDKERMSDFTTAFEKMAMARLCPNTPIQSAVKPALTGDHSHLDRMIKKLIGRRDLVVGRLNDMPGVSCVMPKGAFYAFPSIDVPESDWDFVIGLLQKTGVVTVPGSGFGQRPGTKHLRIVLLPQKDLLNRAMDLFESYLKTRIRSC